MMANRKLANCLLTILVHLTLAPYAATVPQIESTSGTARQFLPRLSLADLVVDSKRVLFAEGKLLGLGPRYRAWFDPAGGMIRGPGRSELALRWTVVQIGRQSLMRVTRPTPPAASGNSVVYERGRMTER